jgi:hypothetical protein
MEKDAHQRLEDKENRKIKQFGWSFAAGMLILTAIGIWKGFILPVKITVIVLGVYHLLFAFLNTRFLIPTYKVMTGLANLLGNALTIVIFFIFFYILFTPVAFLLRLFGKDVIRNISKEPLWYDIPEKDNDPKRVERLY